MGLGSLQLVSLSEARETALAYRKVARSGGDPIAQRQQARTVVPTFEEAARAVHAEHAPTWRNPKHSAQWINTLVDYAFPVLGSLRVDQIATSDVLGVLSAIWLTKPETARRVRQRIRTVLDWATAAGYRSGSNPLEGIEKGLPKQAKRKRHHVALPYPELPGFILRLRQSDASEPVHLAFEFLILTAARTNEVLGARWGEMDLQSNTWTIPPERTKAARQHRVPLSPQCLKILARARELSAGSEFIFCGRSVGHPLSNMAFWMTLRRMKVDVTPHGFRSTFRDWAAEKTNYPRDVCEMALGHVIRDHTEAAYRRGDLFEKRRKLMAAWATYATPSEADVIPLLAKQDI
jgi:integrase